MWRGLSCGRHTQPTSELCSLQPALPQCTPVPSLHPWCDSACTPCGLLYCSIVQYKFCLRGCPPC